MHHYFHHALHESLGQEHTKDVANGKNNTVPPWSTYPAFDLKSFMSNFWNIFHIKMLCSSRMQGLTSSQISGATNLAIQFQIFICCYKYVQ